MKTLRSIGAACFSRSAVPMIAAALLASAPLTAKAQFIVERGWDILHTIVPTQFLGVPLQGVPLGTFDFTKGTDGDFGRGIGSLPVGNADTIIKRLDFLGPLPGGATGSVDLEVVALQLQTTAPTTFGMGLPLDFYFITLQSERGGPLSSGFMDITFNGTGTGGTFNSSLDIRFDIRQGSLTGAIVFSGDLPLVSTNTLWSRVAIPGSLLIGNVNDHLGDVPGNGINGDFHVVLISEPHPQGAGIHTVVPAAAVPEPSTYGLAGSVLIVVAGLARTYRRRSLR